MRYANPPIERAERERYGLSYRASFATLEEPQHRHPRAAPVQVLHEGGGSTDGGRPIDGSRPDGAGAWGTASASGWRTTSGGTSRSCDGTASDLWPTRCGT